MQAAQAQLAGTVHCDFPAWVEFLTHDISVHVPHHVNSKIPWYNLRKANDSLRKNWGQVRTPVTTAGSSCCLALRWKVFSARKCQLGLRLTCCVHKQSRHQHIIGYIRSASMQELRTLQPVISIWGYRDHL